MADIRALFDRARSKPQPEYGDQLTVVSGPQADGQRTWFGFDSEGCPTAVIETDDVLRSAYSISGTVTVDLKQVHEEIRGVPDEINAVVLKCLDASLETSFVSFLEDILERVAEGSRVITSVANAANQLRRLLSLRTTELSEDTALGLFGELHFLRAAVERFGPNALKMWTGPSKKQHDFTSDYACAEIKTSAFQNRSEITVHGLKQLAPLAGLPLTLAVADVEKGTGSTIDEVIDGFSEVGITHGMLAPLLEQAGFTYGMQGAETLRFSLQRWRFWEITAESPVLSYEHLADSTVSAIGNVSYSLNLGSLGKPNEDFGDVPILQTGK